MTKPYLKKRKALRRKVLRGFPWPGKFTTKKEIENYFADHEIQCLLCGKWYKTLNTHLQRIHGTTKQQYCSRFGLPWKRGLACKDLSDKQGKALKKRIREGFEPPVDAARKKSKEAIRRKDQPFLTNIKSRTISKYNVLRDRWVHADYERTLSLMLENQISLAEVCKAGDLPGLTAVYEYRKTNSEFNQKYLDTFNSLPFPVQAQAQGLSYRFYDTIKRLYHEEGLPQREIAFKLGVSRRTVNLHLNHKISGLERI